MTTDKNSLFTVITEEESATVSGGNTSNVNGNSASVFAERGQATVTSSGRIFLSLDLNDPNGIIARVRDLGIDPNLLRG